MNAGADNLPPEAQEEQRLAEFVAGFDELLKTGHPSTDHGRSSESISSDAMVDVARVQQCLRVLEEIWPRHASPTVHLPRGIEAGRLSGADQTTHLGRFQVRRELGRGGFGVVYQAYDPQLQRDVALKVPHAHVLMDAELKARFQQEARAAAVLDHPHVVQIYEAGEADSLAYLALAYCPGVTLAEWLHRRTEPVPFTDAARLIATLAVAVQHAHERGIVHRDLKPSNVLLQESGVRSQGSGVRNQESGSEAAADSSSLTPDSWLLTPRITDFGLAKQVDAGASLTLSGTVLGTPCYMAPEQAGGNPSLAGPAADVYSLGAILYELLTAQPPFHGDTPLETLNLVRFEEPVPPSRLRRSLPADLDTICLCCLEKDPARRFTSARAIADDLNRFLEHQPIRARPIGVVGRLRKWARRKPATAALVAVSVVAVLLLLTAGIVSDLNIRAQRDETQKANKDLAAANEQVVRERDQADQALRREENLAYFRNIALAFQHLENNHMVYVDRFLEDCLPKLRGWEWRYLKRRGQLDLATRQAHHLPFFGLEVSEDGSHVVTTAVEDMVRTWKLPSLEPGPTYDFPHLRDLVLSPSAQRVAGRFQTTELRIMDLATGQETTLAGAFPNRVSKPVLSQDGKYLAAVAAGPERKSSYVLKVWDLSGPAEPRDFPGMATGPRSMAFSPDGQSLAATDIDGNGRVWDVQTGKVRFYLARESSAGAVTFSRNSRWLLSAAVDGDVHLFDALSGQRRSVYRGGATVVSHLDVRDDGQRVAGGNADGLVRVWDLNTTKLLLELRGHGGAISQVAFSRDNRHLLSADHKGVLKIWDALVQRERQHIAGELPGTNTLCFGADSRQIVLASLTDGAKVIDLNKGASTSWWKSAGVAVFPAGDGKHVVTAGGKPRVEVQLRELATGKIVAQLGQHAKRIHALAASHDQRYAASAGDDHIIKVWDTVERKLLFDLEGVKFVRALALDRLGERLASSGDGRAIRIWNLKTGQSERVITGDFGGSSALAFSHDGKVLFSGHTERVVRAWDVATGVEKFILRGHTQPINALALSPDGKRLASAGIDQTVRLWDAETGNEALTLAGHTAAVTALAFSPDGQRLAAASRDGTVLIWDAPE